MFFVLYTWEKMGNQLWPVKGIRYGAILTIEKKTDQAKIDRKIKLSGKPPLVSLNVGSSKVWSIY